LLTLGILGSVVLAMSGEIGGLLLLGMMVPGGFVGWLLVRLLCDLADLQLAALHRSTEHYERVEKRSDGSTC
jgi:hypothetical protein